MGQIPKHARTLIGTDLYTSISGALDKFCLSVASSAETKCSTEIVTINKFQYVTAEAELDYGLLQATAEASKYYGQWASPIND